MRIKSYFAPSVQSAISIARKEFGDDVTLVTSHTASLESRHLGDYEVVFAVEETLAAILPAETRKASTQVIKAAAATGVAAESAPTAVLEPLLVPQPAEVFGDFLQQAIATPLSTEENIPEKLERIETLLMEVGLDGPMVRSLMTMIERVTGAPIPAAVAATSPLAGEGALGPAVAEDTAPEPELAAPGLPDLTPAELAFYLSVSVGA